MSEVIVAAMQRSRKRAKEAHERRCRKKLTDWLVGILAAGPRSLDDVCDAANESSELLYISDQLVDVISAGLCCELIGEMVYPKQPAVE